MTQGDRLHQLMTVWRDSSGDMYTAEEVAAGAPQTAGLTGALLSSVLTGTGELTEAQAESVAAFFKVPSRYLIRGDDQIGEQLALLGHLVSAGAKSVRLRGEPSSATRKALLAAVSRRRP